MFLSVVVTNLWGQLDKSQTRLELPKCTMKTPHIDYKVEISIVFTFPTYSRMTIVGIAIDAPNRFALFDLRCCSRSTFVVL